MYRLKFSCTACITFSIGWNLTPSETVAIPRFQLECLSVGGNYAEISYPYAAILGSTHVIIEIRAKIYINMGWNIFTVTYSTHLLLHCHHFLARTVQSWNLSLQKVLSVTLLSLCFLCHGSLGKKVDHSSVSTRGYLSQGSFCVCTQPMREDFVCNVVSHWLGANTKWSLLSGIPFADMD